MTVSSTSIAICLLAASSVLSISLSNCVRRDCSKRPRTETNGIYFMLKDRIRGNDIYSKPTSVQPVDDSIKLINLRTNYSYPLLLTLGSSGPLLTSREFKSPANNIDTLIFRFGSSVPDTLIVYTGIVKGWRGDECPYVNDAGITKVTLRNQVLVQTEYNDAVFTLLK